MHAADGGGGAISVVPALLDTTAGQVRRAVTATREALGAGTANSCPDTGSGELSAALSEFDLRWTAMVTQAADGGDQLAGGIAAAAASYVEVDTCVVPEPGR